ncbi:hypothetical protein TWF103_003058 [Orbilia oligospora]|nr:hypothetical protein TWF103_003058 [Orbilia oligospora]
MHPKGSRGRLTESNSGVEENRIDIDKIVYEKGYRDRPGENELRFDRVLRQPTEIPGSPQLVNFQRLGFDRSGVPTLQYIGSRRCLLQGP